VLGQSQGACGNEISIDEYDLTSSETRTIGHTGTCWPEVIDSLDASVEGKLVIPSIDGTHNQILDIASGAGQGAMTPIRGSTVWSPDGTMLAFIVKELDSRVGTDGIMLASEDGSCFSEPLRLDSYLYSVDWSPDGSRLVFSTREVNLLYFLDLTTGVGKDLMDSFHERCGE
jgi:Tol biopolymer transport system component